MSTSIPHELFPFVSRRLDLKGHGLHYVDEGDGPSLLMVHGNPTWSFFWRNMIKRLCNRYRVIAVDHMGCGLSDKPKDYEYRLPRHIENLGHLVERLELNDITLFGHDWGGAIGVGLAVEQPQRFRGFVLMNTAAFHAKRLPLSLAACRIPLFGKVMIQGFNAFARGATYLACAKPMSDRVREGYLAPYNSFQNRVATYSFVQDIPMHPSHPSWACLQKIESRLPLLQDKPMALIWGGRDFVFDRGFFENWQQRFPKAEAHWLADAGHYVVEDAPSQVLAHVEAFLRKIH